MAAQANKRGLAIAQKNAIDILPGVQDVVQFAVNEACGEYNQCGAYSTFIQTKPVFHVEYLENVYSGDFKRRKSKRFISSRASGCSMGIAGMSTIIKTLILDGIIQFCDGTVYTTSTVN
jgi:hypothetical protein